MMTETNKQVDMICKTCKLFNSLGNYCEERKEGTTPISHCANWEENKTKIIIKENIKIELPKEGRLVSDFAKDISNELKDKNDLFYRISSKELVEIGRIKLHKNGKELYTGFVSVKPNRFITLVEKYITPGKNYIDKETQSIRFRKKSISGDVANTLLCSEILQQSMPQIDRIFTIPIPIIYEGELTFPKKGFDERFCSWLPYDSPEISNPNMSLKEANKIMYSIYKEFCFQSKQDYHNAIAGLLTPFLRGLFTSFNIRTPVFFYIANRERAGKDYLAGITGIVYEGFPLEEPPISNTEKMGSNNTEELRKKILSAMIGGRKRMHFANNKGFINNAVFEQVATAEKFSDRILGRSENLTFDNEIDYSLSGNTGIGFTPDFANRCRFIRLFLDIEDANKRTFENPNLHKWVEDNRSIILSALFSLVNNWIKKGSKKGSVSFASFPQWSEICGGIMEEAGYKNPSNQDKEIMMLGGDVETEDMKELFELCYNIRKGMWIKKNDIKEIIKDYEGNLFGYLDFDKRSDQTIFGNKISRFVGRILSDIKLIVRDNTIRPSRQEFKFTKEKIEQEKNIFDDGNVGNLKSIKNGKEKR